MDMSVITGFLYVSINIFSTLSPLTQMKLFINFPNKIYFIIQENILQNKITIESRLPTGVSCFDSYCNQLDRISVKSLNLFFKWSIYSWNFRIFLRK
jgi:hypothetical protein